MEFSVAEFGEGLGVRFTVNGFSQHKAIEIGLTLEDMLILRYFVDFKDSGNMICEVINGENYYWLKYEGIIKELPILSMKKDSVYRRLKRMCNLNVLKHKTVKKSGNYSFYTLGSKYIELICHKENSPSTTDEKPEGIRKEIRNGSDRNPEQKINLLKDPSTNKLNNNNNNSSYNYKIKVEEGDLSNINCSTNYKEKKNSSNCSSHKDINSNLYFMKEEENAYIYKLYEENGFGVVSYASIELILKNIESYGKDYVEEAMKEAIRQNKCNLKYVEGILRNWRKKGRNSNQDKGEDTNGIIFRGRDKEDHSKGPSRESIRLELLAKERGLFKEGDIQDIECQF